MNCFCIWVFLNPGVGSNPGEGPATLRWEGNCACTISRGPSVVGPVDQKPRDEPLFWGELQGSKLGEGIHFWGSKRVLNRKFWRDIFSGVPPFWTLACGWTPPKLWGTPTPPHFDPHFWIPWGVPPGDPENTPHPPNIYPPKTPLFYHRNIWGPLEGKNGVFLTPFLGSFLTPRGVPPTPLK